MRLTYLTTLPAEGLEIQERKCCREVHVRCSSGQGGLRIVGVVRFAGLIIVVISCASAGIVVLEADTLR